MSDDSLLERYKAALKAGHVAALRDDAQAALERYAEAAAIAPERALPHLSAANVLLRLGRASDAADAFGRALQRAPGEDSALAGRVEALLLSGRPDEAARDLDRLGELRAQQGRRDDALETLRRAHQLAPDPARAAAVAALERRVVGDAADAEPGMPGDVARAGDGHEPGDGPPPVEMLGDAPTEEVEDAAEREGPPPPPLDPEALLLEGERMTAAGAPDRAAERLLEASVAFAAAGSLAAALDACARAVPLAPAHVGVHLQLAGLYLDSGWRDRAVEKLLLIRRLLEVAPDPAADAALHALIRERIPDESRLVSP